MADGVVFHGEVDQREFATVTARVVMQIETDVDLHLDLQVDLAQFRYTDDSFEILLMPLISPEWTVTPIKPADFPVLRAALNTGEIELRVVTPSGERTFRASHVASDRWLGGGWSEPLPTERDRLLLPIGRDGAVRHHPKAAKVASVRNNPEAEGKLPLKNLVIPPRTTCIFCDDPTPPTVEHIVPNWSRRDDDRGMTVASCDPCNSALSALEDTVANLSRTRAAFNELPDRLQQQVYFWGIKTMWALGKALGIDPLRGAGQNVIARLTARPDFDRRVRLTAGAVGLIGMGTTLTAAIGTQVVQWKGEARRWRRDRRIASYLEFLSQAHKVAELNGVFLDEYRHQVTREGLDDTLRAIAVEANSLRQLQWAVRLTGSKDLASRAAAIAERGAALPKYWFPDGFDGTDGLDHAKVAYLTEVDVDGFIAASRSELGI